MSLTQKLTALALTTLLIASTSISANAQQVTPDSNFTAVDSGAAVTGSALVISIEGGRALLSTLDSLRAYSEGLEKQIAIRDSLIDNKERQLDLCQRSRAQKDTLLKYNKGVQQAQAEVISALRDNQPSTLDQILGYTAAGGIGAAIGQGVCVVN